MIILTALTKVFARIDSWIIFTATAFAAFALSIWMRNFSLIVTAWQSPLFSGSDTLLLLWRLLGGISSDTTLWMATATVSVAVLFGVNAAVFVYYVRQKRQMPKVKENATTLAGFVAAVFGVGCASCGTVLLGALLSSAGASGLLLLLPFGGYEFLLASIGLLLFSTYSLSKSIEAVNVCVS